MLGGAGSPGGDDLLTVTVIRDEHGYGMKVSGDNPVYVQSVKEQGAAWRAGLRAGDKILRVDGLPVHQHTHHEVVFMIREKPKTVLTVHQNAQRHKTPITAPVPVNSEKQRQLEFTKVNTFKLMLENEQKYINTLRNELSKVPDVRKQAQLEASERRCAKLQMDFDALLASQPSEAASSTPRPARAFPEKTSPQNTGFLSGLPRSLSNLTGQSLRNLRQRQNKVQQENQPPLIRQNSDESNKRRHNNTVPIVPTTCLDNTPPPLPPRTIRNPLNPNLVNPLAKPKPCTSISPSNKYHPHRFDKPISPMCQSMPASQFKEDRVNQFRRSSHSLDGDLDGPQPNSIALQMSYPLINAPPPPLQMDNRPPIQHVRSQSSPEQLDNAMQKSALDLAREGRSPPPGTPPPPYHAQPCSDPQRAIISMEEDDSPSSDNSLASGLFSNVRSVLESKARTAVLLNWLLGERRCACANLLLVLSDNYRSSAGAAAPTLRRWAYEIHSTFTMPNAPLQLSGVDENMANEIEHVLSNEYEKEDILRGVFRKARARAKDELTAQLAEFQLKRRLGLGALYGPSDDALAKCDGDKAQEQQVVESLLCRRLRSLGESGSTAEALLPAVVAAALALNCRPAPVSAASGGARAWFLQRDKLYKQRLKMLNKQNPHPSVVRGHSLQLVALSAVAHCHVCDGPLVGLAPQAAVCTACLLRVHRGCERRVDESCCLEHDNRPRHDKRHSQDANDKKSRKTSSGTALFLNMERSFRKAEDEPSWDHLQNNNHAERRDESDESLYESADCHSDAISASDDALPRLIQTPTMSKESLKLAVTDEEVDNPVVIGKKGHRKAMSLSNPLEFVRSYEWLDAAKKEMEKNFDKKKSRESLWSDEDRDSIHGSTLKLDNYRKDSKKDSKDDKTNNNSRKNSIESKKTRKPSKASSVSALNLFRRKKPVPSKTVEAVIEVFDKIITIDEILNYTKVFLEEEQRHTAVCESKPQEETDSEEEILPPKPSEHRRRLSRQASRSKSKVRGKSQSLKVSTLRKSHSGTLKKNKKKVKTPIAARSRQASIADSTPVIVKKKKSDTTKQTAWLFSSHKGENRREGSSEEPAAEGEPDNEAKEHADKDANWRTTSTGGARGVNRAESCRERDAPRRGKHRNASDPNRLTAHHNHDLEPGAPTAPSGSSSSSSLSSRSNESNTVVADQQASQSDLSEEDEPLAVQWTDSLPPQILDTMQLTPKLRKRQEVIHELIVSEGSHVRWLKVLGGVFLRSLESQPSLLPPEELRALFPNLPSVKERHSKLYSDLRAARNEASNHIVNIEPIAEALLTTLGESNYASCLSKFCRGQRMALEALRERRRKNKELHAFLQAREQLPLCGRLQLRDLLACVWQRLTKYQLLLESILATLSPEETESSGPRLRTALATAKEVLHGVDTAVRTAENQHKLRQIQSKLEVRAGAEWDELRRLDLAANALKLDGDLTIRVDNKKIGVVALLLEDMLVLLQRESDKFVLKPFQQPSQQVALSPVVRWDKVIFRPNAAVRNAFFLMNINGVQMHELSTATTAEYTTWVRHIQEAPLAELAELKPTHRILEHSGTNVSRNPSDASEKSAPTAQTDRHSTTDSTPQTEEQANGQTDKTQETGETGESEPQLASIEKEYDAETDENFKSCSPVSRVSLCSPLQLESPSALTLTHHDAHCTETVLSIDERIRRLDSVIVSALSAKARLVERAVGAGRGQLALLADLAMADTLGDVDVSGELGLPSLEPDGMPDTDNMHQLLVAAYSQATQMTEMISSALTLPPAPLTAARPLRHRGRCDHCTQHEPSAPLEPLEATPEGLDERIPHEPPYDPDVSSAAQLAARLSAPVSRLSAALSGALSAAVRLQGRAAATSAKLCASEEMHHCRRAREHKAMDENSLHESVDQTIQDQPGTGG